VKIGVGKQGWDTLRPGMLDNAGKENRLNAHGPRPTKLTVPPITDKQALARRRIQATEALEINLGVRLGAAKLTRKHFDIEHAMER